MTVARMEMLNSRKPLRLWPGVAAVTLQWLIRFVVPLFVTEAVAFAIIGGMLGGVAVLLWWLFFSRAAWLERIGAIVLMAAGMFATSRLVDPSIAQGAMGMLLLILAIPVLSLALVLWAAATRNLSDAARRAALVATVFVACGVWTTLRTGGFTGGFENDLHWRWTKTPEEKLLVRAALEPPVPVATTEIPAKEVVAKAEVAPVPAAVKEHVAPTEPGVEWQGFRGSSRNGVVSGVRIETDWSNAPPQKMWSRPVGPGWSSFAVRGDLLYTQEQRGPEEVVACYRVSTGAPVWLHRDNARFWESNAGAGPRSTPTLGGDHVYTFGATGILNALNATNGALIWSRNAASDTGTKIPAWGFSSSPLLFKDMVVVAVSGQLTAYDMASGAPRWVGPRAGVSYSSPHLITTQGVPQILFLNPTGAIGVSPDAGKVLWEHAWSGVPILQPAVTSDGDILIVTSEDALGAGTRRLAISQEGGEWKAQERWTSKGLKPYFNDFVVHNGHAFGFDGSILSCIDLKDGQRKWKGGRYGHGQLLLVADQDLLLVLSEEGELALVKAVPDGFTEVARRPGIEGKTWNHPVIAGDVLLARNSEEMAAFRLTVSRR